MARKRVVSRTIKALEVTALCVNIQDGEPFNSTHTVPLLKKDADILKAVQEKLDASENPALKAVHIVDRKETEALYEMSEEDFIAAATKKAPRSQRSDTTESADNQ